MNLPELPKQHKQQEAKSGIDLKHWITKNQKFTCGLETKDSLGKDSIPFSVVSDKQITCANLASGPKGLWVRVQGLNGEQDYIWLINTPSYIAIKFPKCFCIITIGNFLFEKQKSKRKSLTVERAIQIASKVIK
jgi:hypothetical protein